MTHRLHPLFFAAAGPLVFSTAFAASVVDLDSPAAVERLQKEHPSQYDTVIRILRDAERLPEQRVEGWIRATYPAESVHLGQLLLVSYPPKRRLSFSLAGVSYYATVVVRLSPPTVDPVDPHVSEQSATR